jgi:hypothetical protein
VSVTGLRDVISEETVLLRWSLSNSLLLPSTVSAEAMPSSLTGFFKIVNSGLDASHSSVVAPMSLGTDWVRRLEVRMGVVGGKGVCMKVLCTVWPSPAIIDGEDPWTSDLAKPLTAGVGGKEGVGGNKGTPSTSAYKAAASAHGASSK